VDTATICANDLRLTASETTELAASLGTPVSDVDAQRLRTAVGGWVAATRIDAIRIALRADAGAASVGKTTLAIHVAQQLREHFQDGQLYADLRAVHDAKQDGDSAYVWYNLGTGHVEAHRSNAYGGYDTGAVVKLAKPSDG
jgi:hypothetical protein